MYLLVSCFR